VRLLEKPPPHLYNAHVMNTSEESLSHTADTLAIVGVGLLGGSIAAAAKKRQSVRKVIGVGRQPARLEGARARGWLDAVTDDLAAAAREADLLVFCTPVQQIVAGVCQAARACRPGTLITDVGSVKGPICGELERGLPSGVEFIGSHPLAGSEKQGFEFADAELFRGRMCVLTPTAGTSRGGLDRTARFWRSLEAHIVEMSPQDHDHALAETSHFPHLAAAALAATLCAEHRPFAATGFRDTTRIASGDPELWTQILLQNRAEVLASLDKYAATLRDFRRALADGEAETLKRLLEQGKQNRDALA
jgi:prephenate dehydrogenase